jgi:hypothetical protein
MTDKELDNVLKLAGKTPHEVDAAAIERASKAVLPSLKPVRPLPSAGVIAMVMQFVFVVVAVGAATYLGFNGIRVLNGAEGAIIFFVLGSLARLAASAGAAEMSPGSKRPVNPLVLLGTCTVGFVAVFAVLFRDYRLDRFVAEGVPCAVAGLAVAAPAGFLLWLVVRRGMVLNPTAAGISLGTLAGLAGLGMLESHCPVLKAMHLMVWHIAVVPLSGLAGYLVGRAAQALGAKRRLAEFIQ